MTSRREIKSWASGIANKFSDSASHYAWLACYFRIDRITIDLIALQITPSEFDIERNRILAGYCRDCLFRNMRKLVQPAAINEAKLVADFAINSVVGGSCVPLTTTVALTDDRNKKWICAIKRTGVLIQN